MEFRAIGFDYGGVLEGKPGSEFNRKASDFLGVDIAKFRESYYKFNHLMNSGQITRDEFWQKVLFSLERKERLQEFLGTLDTWRLYEVNKDVLGLADKLRSMGYKVGILTNNTSDGATFIRGKKINEHFDVLVVSAEIGYSKPDPKAFEIFFQQLAVAPEEAIFIDDSEQSLMFAKEIGFHPILFTSYDALVKELESIGIEILV